MGARKCRTYKYTEYNKHTTDSGKLMTMSFSKTFQRHLSKFSGSSDLARAKTKFSSLQNLSTVHEFNERIINNKSLTCKTKSFENELNDIMIDVANNPSRLLYNIRSTVDGDYQQIVKDRIQIGKSSKLLKKDTLGFIKDSHQTVQGFEEATKSFTSSFISSS